MPSRLDDLAQPGVDALDGVGGIDHPAGVVKSPELLKATPTLVENMLAKIGKVIGLDISRNKQLLAREIAPEVGVSPELMAAEGKSKPKLQDVSTAEIHGETQIKVGARVVATTPKASSLTLVDAATWFRGESNRVAGMIDKSLSLEAQVIQAKKLQQELMEGAVGALYDPALGATLRESFARPSIEKLMAEVGGAGEKQLKAVLEKLTSPDNTRKWFEPGACFAAGTLVHTKEGLVPIEQIKVGDWVLSKPENGGEQAYKRVLKTIQRPSERVITVHYMPDAQERRVVPIVCTVNHPFWVKDLGWTPAKDLYRSSKQNWLELSNGQSVKAHGTMDIYISDQPGVGWSSNSDNDVEAYGALWDYVNHRLVDAKVESLDVIQDHSSFKYAQVHEMPAELYLHLPVYNLEVEDFHTYYVGEHGVWVHNTNCGGLNFEVKGTPSAGATSGLTAEMTSKPFVTRAELNAYLKEHNIESGVFLVRADAKSQAGLMSPEEWARWLKHEEGVSGRIISSDGVRWEYAAVIRHPETGKLTYISVEGLEKTAAGLQVFIDRKLSLIKAGDELEVVRLLNRIAERLEKNPNDRWMFEFPKGARIDELAGLRKAKDLFDRIRKADPTVPVLEKRDSATGMLVPDEEAMARIMAMLGPDEAHSLVQLRFEGAPSIFPQNVITEGSDTSVPALTLDQVNALLPAARQYWISVGASASRLNSATFEIADLPTGFAGQTQGNAITLDASGAGWGWYVDSTPTANTEFDAAVTAMDFSAPLSSEAYGKLDLLTVLIHELGHILGMPSTVSADNVMSQYLTPGQRRLPDAVDIAALQAQGLPYFVGGSTGTGTQVTVPQAIAPVAGSVIVTNPQVSAAAFDPNNWLTQGSVSHSDTDGSSTLTEAATTQTRLNQAFVLGPNDRFLSFTLSGIALDDVSNAPDDAFEVALIDANTGLSLLGGPGLTHNDALLNLQADGTEYKASGVTTVKNADGSRTVLVDLAGIAAGTVVNLSFDLIGFGKGAAATSRLASSRSWSAARRMARWRWARNRVMPLRRKNCAANWSSRPTQLTNHP